MNVSAYKLNNIYDLIEHRVHFLTKRELVATISNKFNISNELAVELYNTYIAFEKEWLKTFKAIVKQHNGIDISAMGFSGVDTDVLKAVKKARLRFKKYYKTRGNGYIEIYELVGTVEKYYNSCCL